MKEITAIIRMDMYDKTKEALLNQGFASMHSRKVMGRGKKKILAEYTLMPKKMLVLTVDDKNVSIIVDTIIRVNSTGNPGNGKIFVTSVKDVIRVRTGEMGVEAL